MSGKGNKKVKVEFRTTPEQYQMLKRFADKHERSVSSAARSLIMESLLFKELSNSQKYRDIRTDGFDSPMADE